MELYKPEKINTQFNNLFDEPSDISEHDTISEVFSNADEADLYIATNQIKFRDSQSSYTVNTTTTSDSEVNSVSSSKND